jgi:hypothetical protein
MVRFWPLTVRIDAYIQGVSEVGNDDHDPAKAVEFDMTCR